MTDRNEEALDRALEGLAREIQPPRDLWPEIDAAIAPAKERFWQWRVAASVFATSLLIGLLLEPPGRPETPVADAGITLEELVPVENEAVLRYSGFDAEFIAVREQSLEQLADRLADLPPATRGVILGNLNIIRQSIAEINAAIEREPNNVELQQLLQIAYRQEMAIVSTVSESASTVDRVRTTT